MKVYINPIIVLGPPRSGTSAVARVLHEKMGVSMGLKFKPDDPVTPEGHYEAEEINNINAAFHDCRITWHEWWERLLAYTLEMHKLEQPWGFKDPKCSVPDVLGYLICFYPDPIFIRCVRKREQVIKSLLTNFDMPQADAENIYNFNTQSLDRILPGKKFIELDMSERRTDEEIATAINSRVGFP